MLVSVGLVFSRPFPQASHNAGLPQFHQKLLVWYTIKCFHNDGANNITTFIANSADYSGAVYDNVDDDTNSGTCTGNIQCFFQVLAIVLKIQFLGYRL